MKENEVSALLQGYYKPQHLGIDVVGYSSKGVTTQVTSGLPKHSYVALKLCYFK